MIHSGAIMLPVFHKVNPVTLVRYRWTKFKVANDKGLDFISSEAAAGVAAAFEAPVAVSFLEERFVLASNLTWRTFFAAMVALSFIIYV
jgi:H+/Cl- antiporter ClcA